MTSIDRIITIAVIGGCALFVLWLPLQIGVLLWASLVLLFGAAAVMIFAAFERQAPIIDSVDPGEVH